jgi:hypothetical protein
MFGALFCRVQNMCARSDDVATILLPSKSTRAINIGFSRSNRPATFDEVTVLRYV